MEFFFPNMVERICIPKYKIWTRYVRSNTDQEPIASDQPNPEFKIWKIVLPKMARTDLRLWTLDLTLICATDIDLEPTGLDLPNPKFKIWKKIPPKNSQKHYFC